MSDEYTTPPEPTPTKPIEGQGLNDESPATEPAPDPVADASSTPAEDQGLDGQTIAAEEPSESFADALSAFERSHSHRATETRQLQGTVVSLSADQVFLDIGYKTEGVLPRSIFPANAEGVNPGDTFPVSVTGRDEEGYYKLSLPRHAAP